MNKLLFGALILFSASVVAAEGKPYSTLEENVSAMDTDHNGMVSVHELRAYIESRHGKNYKKAVLDDLESSADGKSCSSPFAKPTH
jgi:Ca2+-binding EF-hand superfamily protein